MCYILRSTFEKCYKPSEDSVNETIVSWLEEERDIALILSRELGIFVRSDLSKFKNDLKARIEFEKSELIEYEYLESTLQIDNAVSNIFIRPYFSKTNVEMSVTLIAPQDKKVRGQITWIKNQIKNCQKRNDEIFDRISDDLKIDVNIKFSNKPRRFQIDNIEDVIDELGKDVNIKSFNIVLLKHLGKKFRSRKGFVTEIETMLINYYQGIVQSLKKWEKPTPQIIKKSDDTPKD